MGSRWVTGRWFEVRLFRSAMTLGVTLALFAGTTVAWVASAPHAVASAPTGFTKQRLLGELADDGERPTGFAVAPDGRAFISFKSGLVRIYNLGDGTYTTYVDIRDRVNDLQGRGLLSIALDPNFATNQYVYVLFTEELRPDDPDQNYPAGGTILRMQPLPDNPNVADTANFFTVLTGYDSTTKVHGVAGLRFDGQGNLIAGFGDAQENGVNPASLDAYNLDSLHGKIIRINPATGDGLPSNPYYDPLHPDSTRSKVLATGMRNPFRFWPDPVTGKIYVGNVGWQTWEELNVIPTTWSNPDVELNFGWPCYEGGNGVELPQPAYQADPTTSGPCHALYTPAEGGIGQGATPALYAYLHSESGGASGSAIISGPIYRGTAYPAQYQGQLFIADYARSLIRTVDPATGVATDFGTQGQRGGPVDMQIGPDGNIWDLDIDGELDEIVYSGSDTPPTAIAHADVTHTDTAPATIHFSSSGTIDPDPGDTLTYAWNFGDGRASTHKTPKHVFRHAGSYHVTLTVKDGHPGGVSSTSLWIDVANTPPTVAITSPLPDFTWKADDTVNVTIDANDTEDGTLTGASVTWQVVLHHLDHIHPNSSGTGTSFSFDAFADGDDVYYEIDAIATDSFGRSASTTLFIYPRRWTTTIDSSPEGASVVVEGVEHTTPFTFQALENQPHTVQTFTDAAIGGTAYHFDHWQDLPSGSPTSFTFTSAAAPAEFDATFRPDRPGISVDDAAISEGDSGQRALVFDVNVAQPRPTDVTVAFETADGSASAESDYKKVHGTVTIPAGATSGSFKVMVVGDTTVEPDESFTVALSNPTGDVIADGAATGTILNDDAGTGLRASVGDVATTEGDNATRNATFTVSLSDPSPGGVSVHYATANGTATAGSDYTAVSGTLRFGAGATSKKVSIPVSGDSTRENDETFTVNLSAPVGVTLDRAAGTGVIRDDDSGPTLSVSDVTIWEGDASERDLQIPVHLSAPASVPVTVQFTMANVTTDSADVSLTKLHSLTFNPGQTTKDIVVITYADTQVEPDETFSVTLSDTPNAIVLEPTATITILNDDPQPPAKTWNIGDATIREGDVGNRDIEFPVDMAVPSAVKESVNYQVVAGSADSSDIVISSGTIKLTPGPVYKSLSIPVIGDRVPEGTETFTVVLSNPSSGTSIGHGTATGTILDDDTWP